jgi:hypothetical protein
MKKNIAIFLLFTLMIGLAVVYYMYNKPHKNVAEASPDFITTADSLYAEYSGDEKASNAKYLDKIVELTGNVQTLNLENALEPNVVLIAADGEGTVTCGFKPEMLDKIKSLAAGATIKIKGQCKGLTGDASLDLLASPDVVLTNCTVVE